MDIQKLEHIFIRFLKDNDIYHCFSRNCKYKLEDIIYKGGDIIIGSFTWHDSKEEPVFWIEMNRRWQQFYYNNIK